MELFATREGPLRYIFECLDPHSLLKLSCTCTHLYEMINDAQFWRYLINRDCTTAAITKIEDT
jgi:hypothetical protein